MAITEVLNSSNEKEFAVYVNLRSRIIDNLRIQKRITGIKTKNEAIRIEKNLIQEISLKIAHKEGHGFTWRMIVFKWASLINLYEPKYSPVIVADYLSMMLNWTKSWLDRPASEITLGDGREVLNQVLIQGRTKAFQKKLKSTINVIYSWGIENKHIRNVSHSPVYGLKIDLKEEKKPLILKFEEIKKLLKEAGETRHKWYSVWVLALLTGMRSGELYALKWEDVDLSAGLITVQRSFCKRTGTFKSTKAGYWRTVPISSDLAHSLQKIKDQKWVGEFVLPRIAEWRRGEQAKDLKEFCNEIGISQINFHTLRACFSTQLISSGVEPIKVMKVCGWRDLKTMARYIRLAGVEEKGITERLNFI